MEILHSMLLRIDFICLFFSQIDFQSIFKLEKFETGYICNLGLT